MAFIPFAISFGVPHSAFGILDLFVYILYGIVMSEYMGGRFVFGVRDIVVGLEKKESLN